ncbi:MAG: LmeA family phospholipid-binding protein [Jaaginema sp. PMC 1079.18]|nr:LmeA family phospholipid-binding protein [Jaaginema sp. PMC 1080.18]MEC4851731.1 LmeA family phospholipid-binding protein [Jaaginema sp. PMC 1079.18]MEC4865798.1 LmeA family phospholipid-binding protein [Jaaginema sp. PMC 1078.18]
MEIFTIVLSSLLGVLTPGNLVLDTLAESGIRSSLEDAELVEVRVDNTPSYQIAQGKVDRVRVATRGVEVVPGFRIDVLELETDPLDVDIAKLQELRNSGVGGSQLLTAFRKPPQAGLRLVITEEDLNAALTSPAGRERVESIVERVSENFPTGSGVQVNFAETEVDFLDNNRVRLQSQVQLSGLEIEDIEPVLMQLQRLDLNRIQRVLTQAQRLINTPQPLSDREARVLFTDLQQIYLSDLRPLLFDLQQVEIDDLEALREGLLQSNSIPGTLQPLVSLLEDFDLNNLQALLNTAQQQLTALDRDINSLETQDLLSAIAQVRRLSQDINPAIATLQTLLVEVKDVNRGDIQQLLADLESFDIDIEAGLAPDAATKFRLVDPTVAINGNPLPPFIVQNVVGGLGEVLDFRLLEAAGLTVRLLKLDITDDALEIAAFVRADPSPLVSEVSR